MAGRLLYFQDADLVATLHEYLYCGVRRLLYTEDCPEPAFERRLRIAAAEFGASEWEVVRVRGDAATRYRRGGAQDELPVWSLAAGDYGALERALDPAPPILLLRLDPRRDAARRTYNYSLPLGLRERMLVASELARDAGAETVVFGLNRFRVLFHHLFDGQAVCAAHKPGPRGPAATQLCPDGGLMTYSPLRPALSLAAKAHIMAVTAAFDPPRNLKAALVRAILAIQAAGPYQDALDKIAPGREYAPESLLPDEMFAGIGRDRAAGTVRAHENLPLLEYALPGDRIACDHCSLKARCPLYLRGGVCAMPNSTGKSLADMFDTRDGETILAGMQAMLRKKAERVEGAVDAEEQSNAAREDGGKPPVYSDQVTKMMADLQKSAESFLKLADPRYARGPLVQINQQNNLAAAPADPQAEIDYSKAIDAIEAMGVPREEITRDAVLRYLEGRYAAPKELGNGKWVDAGDEIF